MPFVVRIWIFDLSLKDEKLKEFIFKLCIICSLIHLKCTKNAKSCPFQLEFNEHSCFLKISSLFKLLNYAEQASYIDQTYWSAIKLILA